MSAFSNYLKLGYEHIVSYQALDHILFIVVLMAVFQLKNWVRIIYAVTWFTLGHSLTLTFSAFEFVEIDKSLIEFLIPATILLTALLNLTKAGQNQKGVGKYWLAGIFGLIHGLGFSNYYEMLVLGEGKYWQALLPFNLGIELGQLLVVLVMLILMILYQYILNKKHREWNLFLSGAGFGLSLLMCLESWPF